MRRVRSIGKRNNHRVPTKMFTGKEAFVESNKATRQSAFRHQKGNRHVVETWRAVVGGWWVRTHWTLRCIIINTRGVDGVHALKITHPW
jgi:hypothetical protein